MISLENQDLSTAIALVIQEVNRGCWIADRRGAANGGIAVGLPEALGVKARVCIDAGRVIVESISTSVQGAQSQTQNESGTQTQDGTSDSGQSGTNVNTTTNTYTEI